MSLLFLPLILSGTTYFALLDSGASDSFISADVVKQAELRPVPLKEPIRVRAANRQSRDVLHFVRVTVVVGTLHLRLFLGVITTPLPIVLGYPFLQQFNPMINWQSSACRSQWERIRTRCQQARGVVTGDASCDDKIGCLCGP